MMLLDDRPELPMTFWTEMVFRGQLDRGALQSAVDVAVARHPLLRARVEWQGRMPNWVLPDEDSRPVTWLNETNCHQADQVQSLDLRRESGLRVFAINGENRSSVWIHIHHACCDGLGARRFSLDLLTAYARACGAQTPLPEWDTLDYELLRRRHEFAAVSAGAIKTSAWRKLQDAFHFHVLTPRPLAAAQELVGPPRVSPAVKYIFNAAETARLRQLSREANARLNDVAVALLFATLAKWNRRFGSAPQSQRLRVLMPTDLRSPRDDRLPAANRMSFAFIARTIRQCEDWDPLLTGIRSETRYIKQTRIGLDFLAGISLAAQVPGLLPGLLRWPRCMATAVLTNLDDPTRRFRRRFPVQQGSPLIGNVALDRIYAAPPIRTQMHAGIGLVVCSRQMCLGLLGNGQILGDQPAQLLQSYVDHWREWGKLS
jgi:hypothetical protein